MRAVIEYALAFHRLDYGRSRAARERVEAHSVSDGRGALDDRLRVRRRDDGRPFGYKTAGAADVIEVKMRRDQIPDRLARRGLLYLRDQVRRRLVVGTGFESEDVIIEDNEDAVVLAGREVNILAELHWLTRRRRPFDLRQSFRRDKEAFIELRVNRDGNCSQVLQYHAADLGDVTERQRQFADHLPIAVNEFFSRVAQHRMIRQDLALGEQAGLRVEVERDLRPVLMGE